MGYTRNTGQLSYLITYDGSGNITIPAAFTQGSVTSAVLKADAAGKLVAATAGTDYVAPAGLSAYVPTTRTLTINGTAYDLSADRSWTIVSGVSSFNTRTGAITLTSSDVTTALTFTPVTNARTLTINGTAYDLSADRSWSIVAGLSSFNTRTGAITLLDTDVTGALGYTPVTNARTITINGTAYDLSANRTWTVDTSSATTRVIQKFTATASQTVFTITGGYTVGMVDVFLNGIKLDNAVDITASNGTTVTLTVAAALNDIVEVYKYGGQFIANNTLRQTTAFTATAAQTSFTVNYSVGFVDVFYNGSKLAASEFTATTGTTIVLGTACVLNDIVEVVAYNYTVGAFTGVGGSGTVNYLSKWTATGTLNNSLIYDNGTNVGIGTSSPSGLLQVGVANSGIYIDTTTQYTPKIIAAGTISDIQIQSVGNGGNIYLNAPGTTSLITMSTNGAERLRITSAGNVGIGISSPSEKLHIYSSASSTEIRIENSTTSAYIRSQTDNLNFYFNSAERMRISSVGMFQVGTNSSGSAGDWIARIKNASTSGYGLDIQAGNGSGNTALLVRSYNGGVDFLSIRGDGMVILPSQPSFSMWVNASVTGPSVVPFGGTNYNDGGYFNTSTYRFTAPIAGRYFFSFYDNVYANSSAATYFTFRVNATYRGAFAYYSNKSVGNWHLVSFQQIIKLNAGDYVDVYNNSVDRGDYGSDAWGNFSGHLLG